MWYLVPEQVILCFFDYEISDMEKKDGADALVALPATRYIFPGKPNFQPLIRLLTNISPSLIALVTERSWHLMKLFRLDMAWVLAEPVMWHLYPAYQELRDLTHNVKVANDCGTSGQGSPRICHATQAILMMSYWLEPTTAAASLASARLPQGIRKASSARQT